MKLTVIGGGLAGSEAARVLSAAGLDVDLFEMRPQRSTPAHKTGSLAELVCSNSLGSTDTHSAKGLLLSEMRALGSLIVDAATQHSVPAGTSLAVDRERFAAEVTGRLEADPRVHVRREEATSLPGTPTIVATGPLTSDALAASIAEAIATGTQAGEYLYFYDAISPIVSADSIDHDAVYAASRWGKGTPDFLNCPFTQEQYDAFLDALLAAERVPSKDFEKEIFFERCMPIEEMAERGRQTLAFGPMRPVGLIDPRTGKRPHAVVQLRREDRDGQLYNLIGFQTKLRYGEQTRVFRMIPGLENAEFVRLGSVHRNTFINTPALLDERLSLEARPHIRFAGQVMGAEGYAENAASGLLAALFLVGELAGRPLSPPPRETALGALLAYLREADPEHFQPMSFNFGLLPPIEIEKKRGPRRGRKKARREAMVRRAHAALAEWVRTNELEWLGGTPIDLSLEDAS